MNLKIIAVGRVKQGYLRTALKEFTQRINKYSSLEIIEIKEERIDSRASPEKIKEKEAERILSKLDPRAYMIALDEQGKELSSLKLARLFEEVSRKGHRQMSFVIGGALGLSSRVKEQADFILALSRMTFTHEMIRLFLLEQIYRAFTIIRGEPYHNL
ncbi:MAG: 23S rRNA (pseudouridine(1915)-N(3))-methyltransferase RlmH [Deltaproteobacteria bacterium]|nr:MAG: 23S rRNA (pseudouridine(1915)-N(3))-methyltransferase RlmH [Deltaproteobacteria bacterium]